MGTRPLEFPFVCKTNNTSGVSHSSAKKEASSYSCCRLERWTYPGDVTSCRSDAADGHSDAPCRLGDESALLQRVVDPLDAVVLHGQQEATDGRPEKTHDIVKTFTFSDLADALIQSDLQ